MTVTINNLPFDAVFASIEDIDDTTDNPTVTLGWEEDNQGPYMNDGTTETLATELIVTASAQEAKSGGSETFYLTGGAIVSGQTRQVTYTATKRGIPNGEETNPPTVSDTGRYRQHKKNGVWLVNEVISIKDLYAFFNASVAESLNKYAQFQLFSGTQDVTVGDGRSYFKVPAGYNSHELTALTASVITAGTTGTLDVQIHNVTQAVDMLSTVLTIDSGETDSEDAATPYVIDTANDDIATGDIIRVDIDAVQTTKPQGLVLNLTFTNPA